MDKNVVGIRVVSGEDVIAILENGKYKSPRIFVPVSQDKATFMPWPPFADKNLLEDGLDISPSYIGFIYKLNPEIAKSYLQSVVAPNVFKPQGGIIIPN